MSFLQALSKSVAALRRGSLGYFTPALLAILAVGFMVVRIDLDEQRRYDENQRAAAAQRLGSLASALQSNINGNVKLARGLVATIEGEPDIDEAHFQQLCERLLRETSEIRNIAAAPDLIVRLIYPEAPNIKSLGLNYRDNAQQKDAAVQALQSKALALTGPVNLVQGGTGLIARYPVFIDNHDGAEQFWGIVSAVMDLDKLYADSGFSAADLPIEVAISRKIANEEASLFYGRAKLLDQSPVINTIDLGYETWTLAATPKGGWGGSRPNQLASRFYSLVIALFVVGPFLWVGYLMKQRQVNILALGEREDELETLSHRLQLALEASRIGVWEFNDSTGELNWDSRMREIYSIDPAKPACSYEDWQRALHPEDLQEAEEIFARALADETKYVTEFRIVAPTGSVRHVRAFGLTYRDSSGVKRIVGANANVTDDVRMQEELRFAHAQAEVQNRRLEEARRRLEHQSIHDALTGLPNRRFLDQYLEAPEPGIRHIFIHVDLDRFKEINDTLGHAVGDAILRNSAGRLLAVLEKDEFAARIGGDEFIVVAPSDTPEERSQALAAALHDAFSRPMVANGFECRMGASIGVATQCGSDDEVRQLLINADIALYKAKQLGRNRVEFFTEALRLSALNLKKTADELLVALERDEIEPFFQPQFDAKTLGLVGVEALARWQHPMRGILTPDKFLSVAEGLNRVHEIDAIILDKALFQRARWASNNLGAPKLSVNISAQRLRDEGLTQRLSQLDEPPGSLSFELLESISFDGHDEKLIAAIQKIKSFGIEIEIDDFGTGHASITSLLELAPKRLKIDRKIIAPIIDSIPQRRLVSSIIEIGKSLGIEIIAEGVETMAQARILNDLGCDTLQGYAFARPMSAREFFEFLRKNASASALRTHVPIDRIA
jgi:diguanylate cyclase (GGDEF)-like protein